MISSPTAVFAWLAFLVALTFWASSLPAMQRWFRAIPPIIHCYFLPTISTALRAGWSAFPGIAAVPET